MVGFGTGFGFSVNHDVLAAGAGIGIGAVQVIATQTLDSSGSLGTPLIGGVTNGQLANIVTGLPTALVGTYGVVKSASKIGQHRNLSAALLGYGATTLLAGAVVPMAVNALSGTGAAGMARRARAATGTAYTTSEQRNNAHVGLAPAATSNFRLSAALNS